MEDFLAGKIRPKDLPERIRAYYEANTQSPVTEPTVAVIDGRVVKVSDLPISEPYKHYN
jgi:hypothetical protein